jgi:DNA-binding beta-propeller fold protein YncE
VPPQSAATGNRCKLQQDPLRAAPTKEIPMLIRLLAGAVISLSCASCATAQLAVVAVDNKVMMDNGTVKVVPNAPPDNVTVLDLASSPPKIIGEVAAPTSVVGPPLSVAVAPDQSIALVTGAMKIDAAKNQQVPDNKLSVIDLQASPPRVLATLEAGLGATGVSINKAGTLALVANRNEGTVSIFTISGKTVAGAGKINLGDERSGPCHVVFTPDGRRALVTRDGDHTLSLLAIDGSKVESTNRDFAAGLRPYGADITPDGALVIVANIGRGQGDSDTVSVIDMRLQPPRTVNTVTVGPTPEGIKISPDGKWLAVVMQYGTTRPSSSPLRTENGMLAVYAIEGTQLRKHGEAKVGRWSQSALFSADSKTVLVANMVEKDIGVYRIEPGGVVDTGQRVKLNGGPAAMRTAEK